MNFDLLEKLCKFCAISGNEDELRDFIFYEVGKYSSDIKIDCLGNLLIRKGGTSGLPEAKRVVVTAHMDEVGFIITHITEEGFLKFGTVGSISEKVLLGTRVIIGKNKITGVIGATPVHLLDSEDRYKNVSVEDMYIDIGAKNKEDALNYVQLGEYASFEPVFFKDDMTVKAKSLDNRLGCFILLNLIQKEFPGDVYFAFTTKEEVGAIGAQTMAYSLKPDISIVVDSTTAADVYGSKEDQKICKLGGGAVVPFMDKGTIYNKDLYNLAFDLAAKNNIPAQTKEAIAGGTDASVIHKSRCGVKTLGISVPCRYIHAPVGMCRTRDVLSTIELIEILLTEVFKSFT